MHGEEIEVVVCAIAPKLEPSGIEMMPKCNSLVLGPGKLNSKGTPTRHLSCVARLQISRTGIAMLYLRFILDHVFGSPNDEKQLTKWTYVHDVA